MTTLPNISTPAKVTFGAELEFLIPTLDRGVDDPHAHVKELTPVLRIPNRAYKGKGMVSNKVNDREEYVLERVRKLISKNLNITVGNDASSLMPDADFTAKVIAGYHHWAVDTDGSVNEPNMEKNNWVAVEVQSPVAFASPEAFDAVNHVASLISGAFRCRVNASCDVHVHVGQREERFPLELIRRIGALSFAAEPLLFTLQNPSRRANVYCQSLRERGYIARGRVVKCPHDPGRRVPEPDTTCLHYIGRERRHGEDKISTREKNMEDTTIAAFGATRQAGHFEPFQNPPYPASAELGPTVEAEVSDDATLRIEENFQPYTAAGNKPTRTRTIPRIQMPTYTKEQLKDFDAEIVEYSVTGLSFEVDRGSSGFGGGTMAEHELGVFEGTRRIFNSPSSCAIARLLHPGGRPSISFSAYTCGKLTGGPEAGKRTIEFRLAEGTLDGEWIATWSKICVGFVRFAMHASVDEYVEALNNCDLASKQPGKYDVIDFIDDIGLPAEAEVAEKRIKNHLKAWGLKYAV
ncbi:Uu.00g042630.m01.CDS01 [Anthostomella pinea]|uniref:Uu.00g042630.m01.CDS01 n=1 Tax=Anthostomella pinea TaxID=933095 RepID=A0AAI8VAL9_9PEZI|nr:Uu.00g042630.m01.CDS01 [Anthostomella pinea]